MKNKLLIFSSRISFLVAFVFVCLNMPVFSYGGIECGAKKLNVVSTDYFDIIYPPESENAARKIESVCDNYYLEICSLLETDPNMRFPVTITHSVESLNAYFSSVPYNRIVLYDTLPSSSLDMFENTIESVFYHELTHAVSLNMKNVFWRVMSGIFSDALTPAYLTLTTFWTEGVTVSFESRNGGGRLNNPFSTQIVAQAKIENCFPSWRDVTGARDTYPGGTDAYIFGAAFAKYLQDTYGMKMYGDFWRAAGSHLSPTFVSGVFKSVYDKKITDVWNDFRDSYKVPEITEIQLEKKANGVRDFFEETENAKLLKNGFSKRNNKKSVFAYLDSCDDGIVWCDTQCGAVWYVPIVENKSAKTGTSYGRPQKLITMSGIAGLSLSEDGEKIVVSRLVQKSNVKSVVVVCELKKSGTEKCSVKKQYTIKGTGLRDACVVQTKDKKDSYIACVKNITNPVQIALYKINKNSAGREPEKIITLSDNEIPFSLNDAGEGRLAFICKKGLSWSVHVYDSDLNSYDSFALKNGDVKVQGDGNVVLHNLHAVLREKNHLVFTFSWAQLGASASMLPRAGTLDVQYEPTEKTDSKINNFYGNFTLQQNDFSGGITDAVGMRPSLVYAASFYDTTRLMIMDGALPVKHFVAQTENVVCGENLAKSDAAPESTFSVVEEHLLVEEENHNSEIVSNKYNQFSYFTRGVFIPLGVVPVYSHELSDNQTGTATLGATWITSDPWGNSILLASCGYDVVSESGGALFQITKSNDVASLALNGTALFDKKGFLQSEGTLSASYTFYSGNVSSVSFTCAGFVLYGRSYNGYVTEDDDSFDGGLSNSDDDSDGYPDKEDKKYTTANYSAGILFSNVHKVAPGYMQYAGVYAQPLLVGEYNSGWYQLDDINADVDNGYSNVGGKIGARLPGFFPLSLSASLFPSSSYFLSAKAEAVLFSYEIQKGIPAISLYAARFVLSSSYTAYESYGTADSWDIANTFDLMGDIKNMDYADLCTLNADVVIAPNTSAFVSAIQLKLGGEFRFRPNCEEGKNKAEFAVRCILVY